MSCAIESQIIIYFLYPRSNKMFLFFIFKALTNLKKILFYTCAYEQLFLKLLSILTFELFYGHLLIFNFYARYTF